MKNCTTCRLLTEVAGGSVLTHYCKAKNEEMPYPAVCGRFCKLYKPYLDYTDKKAR